MRKPFLVGLAIIGIQICSIKPVSAQDADQADTTCVTSGSRADVTGLKTWCWKDITIPEFSGNSVRFSNNELAIDTESNAKAVTVVGDRLRFSLSPTQPPMADWYSKDYHMRAEIRTAPWPIRNPSGTEEWFGWSLTIGKDYVIDQNCEWLFFQVHNGVVGMSPHVELMIINGKQHEGRGAGEIYVVNNGNYPDYHPTGIVPKAGDQLDIVVHAVWGDASNGLFQVWINGDVVYDKQVATIYPKHPWAGNAKWGIYKWPWNEEDRVKQSLAQGATHLETFMGPLRMITRKPGDPDYQQDAYSLVRPR